MKFLWLFLLSINSYADTLVYSEIGLTGHIESTGGNYEYIPNGARAVYKGFIDSNHSNLTGSIVLDTEENPLEEAWIEYAVPVKQKSNLYLTLGTADVLYGFYNNGLSVLTAGSSTLPQGVYSYDFVKGGFSRIIGLSAEFENTLDNYPVTYRVKYSKGKALVDSQFLLESSLFGGVDSVDVDVFDNKAQILSFSINYNDSIEFFALNSMHTFRLENVTGSGIKDIPTYLASTPNYGFDIKRYGIKLLMPYHTELTMERFTLDLETTNPIAEGSFGGYVTLHQYYTDFSFVIGRSVAKSYRAGSSRTTDDFIGLSYWGDNYTIGLEHHSGIGGAWLTSNPDRATDWHSTILTFGVTF